MSNEATLIWETSTPIPFTVSNSTGIERGALCALTDPMTAALAAANNVKLAGISATEKIANDGKVKCGMYLSGIFRMYASGAINAGQAVSSGADANFPNYVLAAPAASCSGSAILGYALETAAAGETFLVRVLVGAGGNQVS